MPILPPPPPLFSTTTEALIASCIAAAMKRAMMSDGPPGVLATTILTGRSGYAANAVPMRRTAGAASPASAALIRRRRDGDPATLRVSLIRVLREGVAFARDAIGTSRSCDNLDWPSRTSESLRPPVACRLLCESPELRLAPLSLAVLGGPLTAARA